MNNIQYNLIEDQNGSTLSIVLDGELYTIFNSHMNFKDIVEELRTSNPSTNKLSDLIDIRKTIEFKYKQLSELVEIRNDEIYFDNELADEVVSNSIIESIKSDNEKDAIALARFLERLAQNPSSHSKEQLYNWLRDRNFSITEDGMLVAYKGLQSDFNSKFTGKAIVDGQEMEGHIPNHPQTTISMARSEVTFDPNVACAYGLHVGTFSYAHSWAGGGKTMAVLVNPRDVVSVPHDCSSEKMRVSRYLVMHEVNEPINTKTLLNEEMELSESYNWDEDYEEDDYWSEENDYSYHWSTTT